MHKITRSSQVNMSILLYVLFIPKVNKSCDTYVDREVLHCTTVDINKSPKNGSCVMTIRRLAHNTHNDYRFIYMYYVYFTYFYRFISVVVPRQIYLYSCCCYLCTETWFWVQSEMRNSFSDSNILISRLMPRLFFSHFFFIFFLMCHICLKAPILAI